MFSFGIYIVIMFSFCKLEIDIGMIFSYHSIVPSADILYVGTKKDILGLKFAKTI